MISRPPGDGSVPTTPSRLRGRSAAIVAPLTFVLGLVLAACGGAAATRSPVPATPAPTPVAVATATPGPTPAPYEFTSDRYDYRMTLPGASIAEQAQGAWDGEERIDSNGPLTDQVRLPGSILFFVYGAPTDLTTKEYAAQGQAQTAEWHGCPAAPDAIAEVPVSGTPGQLHEFLCQGLLVQKLMVVRNGQGLVLNMLAPPEGEVDPRDLFRQLVAEVTWPA